LLKCLIDFFIRGEARVGIERNAQNVRHAWLGLKIFSLNNPRSPGKNVGIPLLHFGVKGIALWYNATAFSDKPAQGTHDLV